MADFSTGKVTIEAPLAKVEEVLTDVSQYPSWTTAIKSVDVTQSDEKGRPVAVTLSIDAGMMKDRVSLIYDWSQAPAKISFSLTEADLLTAMDGSYTLTAEDEDTTLVTYELHVDLSMPIPAIMRRNAEKATIDSALAQLKTHAEK